MSYLKEVRRKKHLTQKDAAALLGFSRSRFAQIEGGFITPSYRFLLAVKKKFGKNVDMNRFFE